jgi:hypothetical protein
MVGERDLAAVASNQARPIDAALQHEFMTRITRPAVRANPRAAIGSPHADAQRAKSEICTLADARCPTRAGARNAPRP